jgi:hypothetical protein
VQWLPWQDAVEAAVGLVVATVVLQGRPARLWRALATWTRELTLMFALYALWQYAGDLSVAQLGDAVSRGRDLARVERWLHLPSEAAMQRMIIGDHTLVRALNYYYADVHVPALGLCLVWLFARHRACYATVRNVLVVVTGISLLIQLIPIAPPRLVPGLGLIDTGHVWGPSVYPSGVAPGLDQLSSMPSLHVGWALVVAGSVIYALRSPWRWLAALYPVCTTWVVVVTGNHYWADGLAEVAICAFAIVSVGYASRRWEAWRRPGRHHPADPPAPRLPAPVGSG